MTDLTPLPEAPHADERSYTESRRVQLADVGADGQLRLDALARYLQDVANADSADSGLVEAGGSWVLRLGHMRVESWPAFRDEVTATTWCSGTGACWAERRTMMVDAHGAVVADTATTWVHLDADTGRPRRVPAGMDAVYGGRATSRRVKARLQLPADPPPSATARPWPLRLADLDLMAHVNNAAALTPLVEVLGERKMDGRLAIDLEHPAALALTPRPTLHVADADGGFDAWLQQGDAIGLVAQVRAR